MHWEFVFPIEQQVYASNKTTPDLSRTTSSKASTLIQVEIQIITLTSDKELQKYRGKKAYYQLFHHPELPKVDSMQFQYNHCAVKIAQRSWIYVAQQGKPQRSTPDQYSWLPTKLGQPVVAHPTVLF